MKRQAYTIISMIVLVGSLAVAAKAQKPNRTQLIANIPFQFNVGNETLPAGEYTVLSVMADSSNVVLKMQNQDGFFAQAWVDGEKFGLQAPKSRAERVTEREFAAIKMTTESVTASARR